MHRENAFVFLAEVLWERECQLRHRVKELSVRRGRSPRPQPPASAAPARRELRARTEPCQALSDTVSVTLSPGMGIASSLCIISWSCSFFCSITSEFPCLLCHRKIAFSNLAVTLHAFLTLFLIRAASGFIVMQRTHQCLAAPSDSPNTISTTDWCFLILCIMEPSQNTHVSLISLSRLCNFLEV